MSWMNDVLKLSTLIWKVRKWHIGHNIAPLSYTLLQVRSDNLNDHILNQQANLFWQNLSLSWPPRDSSRSLLALCCDCDQFWWYLLFAMTIDILISLVRVPLLSRQNVSFEYLLHTKCDRINSKCPWDQRGAMSRIVCVPSKPIVTGISAWSCSAYSYKKAITVISNCDWMQSIVLKPPRDICN